MHLSTSSSLLIAMKNPIIKRRPRSFKISLLIYKFVFRHSVQQYKIIKKHEMAKKYILHKARLSAAAFVDFHLNQRESE